eukprot:TRINITY_DN23397_c0_g1_i2.p1 TRINITY_DN23397_c0_g1~~TRINITY_DN23397_c0_g1_i2.p1  ORF type:complete len:577 (-),score=105.37 TRINITY_DN23397_c0_g1_i2:1199-2755(-)
MDIFTVITFVFIFSFFTVLFVSFVLSWVHYYVRRPALSRHYSSLNPNDPPHHSTIQPSTQSSSSYESPSGPLLHFSSMEQGGKMELWYDDVQRPPATTTEMHLASVWFVSIFGFWWKGAHDHPKVPVWVSRCSLALAFIYEILYDIDRAIATPTAEEICAKIADVLLFGFFVFAMCRAWKMYDAISPFLQQPNALKPYEYSKRLKRNMLRHLWTLTIPFAILPLFAVLSHSPWIVAITIYIFLAPCFLVAAYISECCDMYIRELSLDACELYFGRSGTICSSLEDCVQKFHRYCVILAYASRALTAALIPPLFSVCVFAANAVASLIMGIKGINYITSATVEGLLLLFVLVPAASTNTQIRRFRNILHTMCVGSLHEEDIGVHCDIAGVPLRGYVKKHGSRVCLQSDAHIALLMQKFHSNTSTTHQLEESKGASTDEDQGEMIKGRGFDEMGSRSRTLLSSDDMALIQTSVHYVDEYLNGLRAFGVLVTGQMLITLSGFLGTFVLLVLKFEFGIRAFG